MFLSLQRLEVVVVVCEYNCQFSLWSFSPHHRSTTFSPFVINVVIELSLQATLRRGQAAAATNVENGNRRFISTIYTEVDWLLHWACIFMTKKFAWGTKINSHRSWPVSRKRLHCKTVQLACAWRQVRVYIQRKHCCTIWQFCASGFYESTISSLSHHTRPYSIYFKIQNMMCIFPHKCLQL